MTLLMAANASGMYLISLEYSGQHWPVLLAALGGGLFADGLAWSLKPSVERVGSLRLFAFAVPLVQNLLFFGVLLLTRAVVWRVQMWLGVSLLAGVVGLGLSYLLAPPAMAAE